MDSQEHFAGTEKNIESCELPAVLPKTMDTSRFNYLREKKEGNGEPLQVIVCNETDGIPVKLIPKNLTRVFYHEKARDRPVVLFSVAGAFRTGKSFLLNFLIRYLKAREENNAKNWLENSDGKLEGFPWEQGAERITEGVLLWSKPFVLTLQDESEVAVILMDTQGLFDDKEATEVSNTMVSLSTLLSSIQVYNVLSRIDENHLSSLELFTETGMMLLNKKEGRFRERPFQRLVFLVRDWIGKKGQRFGGKAGEQYLIDLLQPNPNRAPEKQRIREYITDCFESLQCFLMPHPGLKVTQLTAHDSDEESDDELEPFEGNLKDIEQTFIKKLKEIVGYFFDDKNLTTKKCGGKVLLGREMVALFKNYTGIFSEKRLPLPTKTRETLIKQFNELLVTRETEKYEKMLERKEEKNGYIKDIVKLEKDLAFLLRETLAVFDAECRGNQEDSKSARDSLIEKISVKESNFKMKNEYKRAELKEENEELCRNAMDRVKNAYNDTMVEFLKTFPNGAAEDELDTAHKAFSKTACKEFEKSTPNCQDERKQFLVLIKEYLAEQFSFYVKENDWKRKKRSDGDRLCLEAHHSAIRHYQKSMEMLYMVHMQATTIETLNNHHACALNAALAAFEEMTASVEEKQENIRQDLIEALVNEKRRYEDLNKKNLDLRDERDDNKAGYARWTARCAYREIMEKECAPGEEYKDEIQFNRLHLIAVEKAENAFLRDTEKCHGRPKEWKNHIKWNCEDCRKDIINMNELNNPGRQLK